MLVLLPCPAVPALLAVVVRSHTLLKVGVETEISIPL